MQRPVRVFSLALLIVVLGMFLGPSILKAQGTSNCTISVQQTAPGETTFTFTPINLGQPNSGVGNVNLAVVNEGQPPTYLRTIPTDEASEHTFGTSSLGGQNFTIAAYSLNWQNEYCRVTFQVEETPVTPAGPTCSFSDIFASPGELFFHFDGSNIPPGTTYTLYAQNEKGSSYKPQQTGPLISDFRWPNWYSPPLEIGQSSFVAAQDSAGNNLCFAEFPVQDIQDLPSVYNICSQIPDTADNAQARLNCYECATADPPGIWTAIGCIRGDPAGLVQQILTLGLGMAGGVALLMFLTSAFLFTTAQNDPKRVSQAKEIMTSAIIGLLFIIFSVTILQFLGVTILQIPDFGV